MSQSTCFLRMDGHEASGRAWEVGVRRTVPHAHADVLACMNMMMNRPHDVIQLIGSLHSGGLHSSHHLQSVNIDHDNTINIRAW